MSKEARVVRPDTSVQEVAATLNKFRIDSVIVVQKDKPIGIVTVRDIMNRLVEENVAPRLLTARDNDFAFDDDWIRGHYRKCGETYGAEEC